MNNHIVECAQEDNSLLNTGAKEQCTQSPVIRHALATSEQEFATATAAKTLALWKADRDLKNIFPLYEIEELAIADTADSFKEGNKKYRTSVGKKIRTFNCVLGPCSHRALKSFHGKKMRVYEFTEAQETKATTVDGTKVRGQLVTIEVGKLVDAVKDNYQYSPVTLTYEDYNEFENHPVVLKPDWSHIDLNGIMDVELKLVSASATSIKFTVDAGCAGDVVTSLENANITLKTALGVAVTHSFVTADANGVYELTGTGFVNTLVLDLNGVVARTEDSYESVGPLSITGI